MDREKIRIWLSEDKRKYIALDRDKIVDETKTYVFLKRVFKRSGTKVFYEVPASDLISEDGLLKDLKKYVWPSER